VPSSLERSRSPIEAPALLLIVAAVVFALIAGALYWALRSS
jgi:hypothetical protein